MTGMWWYTTVCAPWRIPYGWLRKVGIPGLFLEGSAPPFRSVNRWTGAVDTNPHFRRTIRSFHGESEHSDHPSIETLACPSSYRPVCGQPTWHTHPHLILSDQLTLGIPRQEFHLRRKQLGEALPEQSMVVLAGQGEMFMSNDIPYPFHQNTNFHYLTGYNEPDALAILLKTVHGAPLRWILFVRPHDPAREVWDGPRAGIEGACNYFDATEAYPIQEWEKYLDSLLSGNSFKTKKSSISMFRSPSTDSLMKNPSSGEGQRNTMIHHVFMDTFSKQKGKAMGMNQDSPDNGHSSGGPLHHYPERLQKILSMHGFDSSEMVHSLEPLVAQQRLYKSLSEIALMERACNVTTEAIHDTLQMIGQTTTSNPFPHPTISAPPHFSKEGISESRIHAFLEYKMRWYGANHLAYPPVIAGGKRATILHYIQNDQLLSTHDLLLMDVGCTQNMYVSDITRTVPMSTRFSDEQRRAYSCVFNVQQECIQHLEQCIQQEQPITLNDLHALSVGLMAHRMMDHGILRKEVVSIKNAKGESMSESSAVSERRDRMLPPWKDLVENTLYPHHIGHYLGMDVHDTLCISREVPLRPGMVITIEPGLYFPVQRTEQVVLDAPTSATQWRKWVDERYEGIGIRIEDNVLIEKGGIRVLSQQCVRHMEDIERIMSK